MVALLLAEHATPLSDHIERAGLIAGSGAVLGGIGGFAAALLSHQISAIEGAVLGIFSFELDLPKYEFGTAVASMGAIGSIGILLFKTAEYYGAF